MKIHHIGYLVKNITAAKEEFEKLGFWAVSEEVFDPSRVIDIVFLEKDGYQVELISPQDESSVAYSLMKKHRNSPYHLCYVSDEFETELEQLCRNGYTLIEAPQPAPALGNRRVAFLMNYDIGMIEILEEA